MLDGERNNVEQVLINKEDDADMANTVSPIKNLLNGNRKGYQTLRPYHLLQLIQSYATHPAPHTLPDASRRPKRQK